MRLRLLLTFFVAALLMGAQCPKPGSTDNQDPNSAQKTAAASGENSKSNAAPMPSGDEDDPESSRDLEDQSRKEERAKARKSLGL